MSPSNLEQLLATAGNPVHLLRNSQLGAYVYPVVPSEFTNWRDEQRAWRETAVLFDQSHHMPELFLKGPDALKLLIHLGINSFANFAPGRAKQYVACNHNGQVIGECILYYLDQDSFELVSGMHLQDWVHFNAEIGNYNVTVERDPQTAANSKGRTRFR